MTNVIPFPLKRKNAAQSDTTMLGVDRDVNADLEKKICDVLRQFGQDNATNPKASCDDLLAKICEVFDQLPKNDPRIVPYKHLASAVKEELCQLVLTNERFGVGYDKPTTIEAYVFQIQEPELLYESSILGIVLHELESEEMLFSIVARIYWYNDELGEFNPVPPLVPVKEPEATGKPLDAVEVAFVRTNKRLGHGYVEYQASEAMKTTQDYLIVDPQALVTRTMSRSLKV